MLTWLAAFSAKPDTANRVIWIETTQQNYPNSIEQNGYYDKSEVRKRSDQLKSRQISPHEYFAMLCPPFANITVEADWRNNVPLNMIREMNLSRVSFFSMGRDLVNVVDMFTVGYSPFDVPDCTHHCYHPLMWQPLWHHLAEVATHLIQ